MPSLSQAIYGSLGWFFYNGIAIQITALRQLNKQAIYNGPDYLFTRNTVHITGYLNPSVTSYNFRPAGVTGQGRPNSAIPQYGNDPSVTINAIQNQLLEPRRQLWWIIGPTAPNGNNQVLLASPDPNLPWNTPLNGFLGTTSSGPFPVDANNGPVPLFCNITQMHGTKTFVVEYIIQTDLNQAYMFSELGIYPSPLLSNRWSMEQSWDEQYFTTRTIHGRAIFRTDALALLGARPDDFRDWFFFPVPLGFKRLPCSIVQNADGTQIDYTIVDQEQQISVTKQLQINYGVVKIEGSHTLKQGRGGLEHTLDVITGISSEIGRGIGNIKNALAGHGVSTGIGSSGSAPVSGGPMSFATGAWDGIKALLGGVAHIGVGAASAVETIMPTQQQHISLRIWGDLTATRDSLTIVGLYIIASRVQQSLINAALNLPGVGLITIPLVEGQTFILTHDLLKKFAQLDFIWEHGPIMTFVQNGTFQVAALSPMIGQEFIPGVTGDSRLPNAINPSPAGSDLFGLPNSSRGLYLADLVAAALQPSYNFTVGGGGPSGVYPPNNTLPTSEPLPNFLIPGNQVY